jgi:hypothetical protein
VGIHVAVEEIAISAEEVLDVVLGGHEHGVEPVLAHQAIQARSIERRPARSSVGACHHALFKAHVASSA